MKVIGYTMDGALFEFWFKNRLVKEIEKDSAVIMDSAAVHEKARLFAAANANGIRLIFQSTYSSDLNKIEHFQTWLKKKLRTILPFFSSPEDAICEDFKCYLDEPPSLF